MIDTSQRVRDQQPWWAKETPIRFSDLPNHLPRNADGTKVSLQSAYRYGLKGVAGLRLRRFRASGHAWATTLEELHRWQQKLTQTAGGDA